MNERTSCPTKDQTWLVLQGQGLTVDPSCRSRRGLSRKQEGNRNHTTLGRIGSTPYNQHGLEVDDQEHHIETKRITPPRHPVTSQLAHLSGRQAREKEEVGS